jgi:hypothetical protein
LKYPNLSLDFILGVSTTLGSIRVDVAHMQEVFVHLLEFNKGSGSVHGRWREGVQQARQGAQAGDDDDGAFPALDDAPVFQQATGRQFTGVGSRRSGGLALVGGGARGGKCRRSPLRVRPDGHQCVSRGFHNRTYGIR